MPRPKKVDANSNAPAKVNNSQKKIISSTPKQPTANEMREWYEKNKSRLERYEDATSAITSLRDIQKSSRYTSISNYSKEDVKSYIKNISSNEKNLRSLSRYLYYRSEIYYRLCKYYANQIDLTIRNIVPPFIISSENDVQSTLQKYQETVDIVDTLGLNYEFRKAASITLREDVFYGCAYYTEGQGMFVLPLDPDYMKIAGMFPDGSFAGAMDMSYFRSHQELLEGWCTDKIYRQNYTKDGDNVAFDGERIELFRELLTASEKAELESMRSNYAALKEFKEIAEKNELHAQKEAIINADNYSVLTEKDSEGNYVNTDFAELVKTMDNYSVEDFETKVKVMHSDYMSAHANFSSTGTKKNTKLQLRCLSKC